MTQQVARPRRRGVQIGSTYAPQYVKIANPILTGIQIAFGFFLFTVLAWVLVAFLFGGLAIFGGLAG